LVARVGVEPTQSLDG